MISRKISSVVPSRWLRLALVVLLLASHGLVLAHSGDHLLDNGTQLCDVCTAGHALSGMADGQATAGILQAGPVYFNTPPAISAVISPRFSSDAARAPPATP